MFHHAAWAVGSCSSGPPAAGTVGTQSTGGFYQPDRSPCTCNMHWQYQLSKNHGQYINFQVASGARGRGVLRLLLVQQQIILFCIPAICLQLYIVVYPSAILPILPCLTLEILLMMVTTNGTIGHLTVALGR